MTRACFFSTVIICVAALAHVSTGSEKKTVLPDSLTGAQLHLLDSIEHVFTVRQCCGGTLADCLARKPSCALAAHFHEFLKWLVARGTKPPTIAEEFYNRDGSLTSAKKAIIDTTAFPIAGDRQAPVLITLYVSASCPICHLVGRELYNAVTLGALVKKARLMLKPLGDGFGNRSLCAANEVNRFWEYFIAIANVKTRLDSMKVYSIIDSMGISVASFKKIMNDPKTDSKVMASTKEAGINGVTLAPTVFIDRVRYKSYKDPMWIIDAAEYKYEILTKSK